MTQITDTWAQTIILANNNITIPAGSTSAGIGLLHPLLRAEIPEYVSIKLKNSGEYSAEFNMDITEISTQGELDNFVTGQAGYVKYVGSFNSTYDKPENQPADYINIQEGDALNYSIDLTENEINKLTLSWLEMKFQILSL